MIHVRDCDQTLRNVRVAVREGAPGVFLINHNFSYTELLPTVRDVRREMPSLWLGVNFLGVTGECSGRREGGREGGLWAFTISHTKSP